MSNATDTRMANDLSQDESYYTHTFAPAFRELRREELACDFEDTTRPDELKKANWPAIHELCRQALDVQLDLRVACHYVEAGLRIDSWTGLTEGLAILTSLVKDSWEYLLPAPHNDDYESRAIPLTNLLDDPDRGVRLPSVLQALPLLGTDPFISYDDLMRMKCSLDPADHEPLIRFRSSLPPEYFRGIEESIAQCVEQLRRLSDALHKHMGDAAPTFLHLQRALTDFHELVLSELALLGVDHHCDTNECDKSTTMAANPLPVTDLNRLDREGLYYLLDQAASRLNAMEPHSPIPYLVKRAVRLGRLPFPDLMKQVIREESIIAELNREFGIADCGTSLPDS